MTKETPNLKEAYYPAAKGIAYVFLFASPIAFVINIIVYLKGDYTLVEAVGQGLFVILFFFLALKIVRRGKKKH